MWHFVPVKSIEELVDKGISAVEVLTVEDDTDNALLFIVLWVIDALVTAALEPANAVDDDDVASEVNTDDAVTPFVVAVVEVAIVTFDVAVVTVDVVTTGMNAVVVEAVVAVEEVVGGAAGVVAALVVDAVVAGAPLVVGEAPVALVVALVVPVVDLVVELGDTSSIGRKICSNF
jgi:hypothetical protein